MPRETIFYLWRTWTFFSYCFKIQYYL